MNDAIKVYWQQFLDGLPADSPYRSKSYIAEGWGDGPDMAEELGQLIAEKKKTATCSSLWEWEAEGEPIPEVGLLTIVLDGKGLPLCIVETIEINRKRYDEVDAEFAAAEGEGDLSLQYWRDAHRRFFSRTLAKIGREFSPEMPLVCERFRVIYP